MYDVMDVISKGSLYERSDALRQPVVLLKVDDEIGVRPRSAHLGEGGDVLRGIDGDADDVGTGSLEQLHLTDRGGDVLRPGGGHRLDSDGVIRADRDIADADFAGNSRFHRAL